MDQSLAGSRKFSVSDHASVMAFAGLTLNNHAVLWIKISTERPRAAREICPVQVKEPNNNLHDYLSRDMTKPTKWHVCPAKTQISLGIRPV